MANKITRRRIRRRILFVRRKIQYVPNFRLDVEQWTKRTIAKHFWRVRGLCEPDDLLQDAWVLFLKLKQKYTTDGPAHFGKLFRTSFANHFHTLSSQRTHRLPVPLSSLINVSEMTSSDADEIPLMVRNGWPVDGNLGPQLCAIKETLRRMRYDRATLAYVLRDLAPNCDLPRFVNPQTTTDLLNLMTNETFARPRRRA